jgi:uncharacterized integral membrane protein
LSYEKRNTQATAMIRKIVSALILVPLAIVFIVFAVANRQVVIVSLDPFDPAHPTFALALPLFVLILALIIGGVVVGGMAAWLKQSKWRRAARRAELEARALRAEVDALRRSGVGEPAPRLPVDYAPRLTIPPPAG